MTFLKEHTDRASCVGSDPEIFYKDDPYAIKTAKDICYTCPIRGRCLADAMINEQSSERYGIWGAHTPGEREEYAVDWKLIHGKNLDLLNALHRRDEDQIDKRRERRRDRAMVARRVITPTHPRYDDFRRVLDMVISNPNMTSEHIGLRIDRSESWVNATLHEAFAS